jgi:hypothetical protein
MVIIWQLSIIKCVAVHLPYLYKKFLSYTCRFTSLIASSLVCPVSKLRSSEINVYDLVHVTDIGLYAFLQFLRVIARQQAPNEVKCFI